MPTEVPPAATAAKAYSICTNLPEGLQKHNNWDNINQKSYRNFSVNQTE